MVVLKERWYVTGLGDAWGAVPPPIHPREASIKELGSHLLQVSSPKRITVRNVSLFA